MMAVAIFAAACASCTTEEETPAPEQCTFTYTDKIRDEIVVPILRKQFGANAVKYRTTPFLTTTKGNIVRLSFDEDHKTRGYNVLKTPYLEIGLDICTLNVVSVKKQRVTFTAD